MVTECEINRSCAGQGQLVGLGEHGKEIVRSVIPVVYIRTTVDQWSRNSSQNTIISVCTI